jgi:hypothetical protein
LTVTKNFQEQSTREAEKVGVQQGRTSANEKGLVTVGMIV